jgi:hypothetical protein
VVHTQRSFAAGVTYLRVAGVQHRRDAELSQEWVTFRILQAGAEASAVHLRKGKQWQSAPDVEYLTEKWHPYRNPPK